MGTGSSKHKTPPVRSGATQVIDYSQQKHDVPKVNGARNEKTENTKDENIKTTNELHVVENLIREKTSKTELSPMTTSTLHGSQGPVKPRPHRPKSAPRKSERSMTRGGRPKTPGGLGSRGRTFYQTSIKKDVSVSSVLYGDMSVECPPTAKIVRIFTSSTFTDTEHERNALMERVYPALKEKCHQLGYEFQVVDMRWGVRDEATDDHMTSELCLREIDLCMKLSTGPCFVTFLSHKYGYRPLPSRITSEEFHKVIDGVSNIEDLELITRWYLEDTNAIPSTFVLQPVSFYLPDYLTDDEERRKAATQTWYSESDQMKLALEDAARKMLDEKDAHRYVMSVTEQEIAHALFTPYNMAGRSAWFHRRIKNIDSVKNNPKSSLYKFKDVGGSEKQNKEAEELLTNLRDNKLPVVIPDKCHLNYSIAWHDQGVDPANVKEHRQYIDQLCEDFEKTLMGMVRHGIKNRTSSSDRPVFGEVVQHLAFCQHKCSLFHGRENLLKEINKFIRGTSEFPLVVHGVSGSGKTSVVAMAAKQAWETHCGRNGKVIIRFIGTTPESSSVCSLLKSVTLQLWALNCHEGPDLPNDLKDLANVFQEALSLGDPAQPLTIIFDSLDQLDPSDNGRHLTWLPTVLPTHVKLIVSTLPEAVYECMPRLQAMLLSRATFIEVPKLPDSDAMGILDKWLEVEKRQLTDVQREIIQDGFRLCPLPLYLKLVFDAACKWRSYTPPHEAVLESTVRGCIQELFSRIERAHGRLFVSRALGYITLSKSGLTESELEDILSCDDDVLNDVYMYWTPPVRRLPPLLLVRLRTELDHYMVDKGVDGVSVYFWYHRQFIEAAHERYCNDDSLRQQMHGAMADFFSGIWAQGKKKPFTDKQEDSLSEDRYVSDQPLKFGTEYNYRLLNNLPYHRLGANQLKLLKSECLCNFPFLQAKLIATGLRSVQEDFLQARTRFGDDSALSLIGETLQLSQGALMKHPHELPSQLLGRIQDKMLSQFLSQCSEATLPYLVASQPVLTRPGGQLVHCLAGHKGDITGLAMTGDGEYALTCSTDKSMKIWSLNTGKLHRSIDGIGEDPDTIRIACNDQIALVNPDGAIVAFDVITGHKKYEIGVETVKAQFCVAGKRESTLGVFMLGSLRLYRATDGKMTNEVECDFTSPTVTLGDYGPSAGCGNYMVNTDNDQKYLFMFDLAKSAFTFMHEAFPVTPEEETSDGDVSSIDAVALLDDGNRVAVLCVFNSDVHILDSASMTLLQVLKGSERDMTEKLHVTPDCRYLYFASQNNVIAWDMTSSERYAILQQSTTYTDVVTADMELLVTTGSEHVIKIWDLSREASTDNVKQGEGFSISHFAPLENPRYVVLFGTQVNAKRYFKVHDLVTCTDVRKLQVNADIMNLVALDNERVLARVGRKLKIVDFSEMAVTLTFQGKLPFGSYTDYVVTKSGKEVVSVTRGRHHVKVYNTSTGKVTQLIKIQNEKRIICLVTNQTSTTLVAETEEGCYLVCDLSGCSFLYKFDPMTLFFKNTYTDHACVTEDGQRFIFSGEKYDDDDPDNEPPHRIFIWNIKTRELEREMTDTETYDKFLQTGDTFYDTGVDSFLLVSHTTLLANLHDGLMRTFDINTGEVTKTLPGHTSARMCKNETSPYLVTRGTWTEDQTLRIVDGKTLETVASYTPDNTLSDLRLTSDGHHVVGYFPNYPHPVVWSLKGSVTAVQNYKTLGSFPRTYSGKVQTFVALLLTSEDDIDDPEDPDTDNDEDVDDVIVKSDDDFTDYDSD